MSEIIKIVGFKNGNKIIEIHNEIIERGFKK